MRRSKRTPPQVCDLCGAAGAFLVTTSRIEETPELCLCVRCGPTIFGDKFTDRIPRPQPALEADRGRRK